MAGFHDLGQLFKSQDLVNQKVVHVVECYNIDKVDENISDNVIIVETLLLLLFYFLQRRRSYFKLTWR